MFDAARDPAMEIRSQGFTTFPGALPAPALDALAEELDRIHAELGEPPLHCRQDRTYDEGVIVNPVGMVVPGILRRVPELCDLLARPELLDLFESLLGPGFVLEMGTGVLSDHTRPFFFWHNHMGGIDGDDFRRKPQPTLERVERLVVTMYRTALDESHGTLLMWPRSVGESSQPPFADLEVPWPDCRELALPAFSLLIQDQCTWHAVGPMTEPGRRHFAGVFVRRSDAPVPKRVDPSIAPLRASDPRVGRAYR